MNKENYDLLIRQANNDIANEDYDSALKILSSIRDNSKKARLLSIEVYKQLFRNEDVLNETLYSASKGDIESIIDLCEYFENGSIYTEKDSEKALKYALLGIEQGSVECKYLLANSYYKGTMTKVDYKEAVKLYNQILDTIKNNDDIDSIDLSKDIIKNLIDIYTNNNDLINGDKKILEDYKKEYEKYIEKQFDYEFIVFPYVEGNVINYSDEYVSFLCNYLGYKEKEYYENSNDHCMKLVKYLDNNYQRINENILNEKVIPLIPEIMFIGKKGYYPYVVISDDEAKLISEKILTNAKSGDKISLVNAKKQTNYGFGDIIQAIVYLINKNILYIDKYDLIVK